MRIANHGGEAVKILTESDGPPPFDVVFMDLQMPEMDGFTATKLIRARAAPSRSTDHRDDCTCVGGGTAALHGSRDERSRQQSPLIPMRFLPR